MKGKTHFLRLISSLVILAMALAMMFSMIPFHNGTALAADGDPVINEFVFNHTGTDNFEFVELYAPASADLSAYTLLEIEGDSSGAGVIDGVFSPDSADATGYWTTGFLVNEIENGTVTLKLVEGFSGSAGDDLDPDNDGILDFTPWTEVLDDVAVFDGGSDDRTYASTVLEAYFDGMPFAPGGASRIPNAIDSDTINDWVRNDFDGAGLPGLPGSPTLGEALNTPGSVNKVVGPIINEFVFNHTGTDNFEFVELYAPASADLSAYTLLEIEGDSSGAGVIDGVFSPDSADATGYWTTGFLVNEIENGTVTLKLVEGFSGSVGDDLDPDNDGILDFTPWTEVLDDVAVFDGGSDDRTYASTVLEAYFDGMPFAPGGASRIPNAIDSDTINDWVRNDFDGAGLPGLPGSPTLGEALNTPGTTNEAYVPPTLVCYDVATYIHEVQGDGLESPIIDETVIVEGVVVGDFQDTSTGLSGFFLQEEDTDADGNPMTSEGVFIYDRGFMDVNEGDVVRVQGTVTEYRGLTELSFISDMAICDSGASVTPATVTMPVASVDTWEYSEGMLLTLPQTLYATGNYTWGRYGEVDLSIEGRQYTPTNVVMPGEAARTLQDLNDRSRIQLDDGSRVQNPLPMPPYLGADNTLRAGDSIPGLSGVLAQFDIYEIHPTQSVEFTRLNERQHNPADVGGTLKVAGFNVLNYFTTLDGSGAICGPEQNQDCRGADTPEEFERQRNKIISALVALDADVVGLIELENHPEDVPIADLVSGLNQALGGDVYAYIPTAAIGTDAIRVGLIYKPAKAQPVGDYAILDSSVDPTFNDDRNRPVLAQAFVEIGNTDFEPVTVAVNHLKSKGSACDDIGDPDTGDGQGNCNLTRLAAAQAQVNWLAGDPTGSGSDDYLIIGDLNSYAMEDPIAAIESAAYSNLVKAFEGLLSYSYQFFGQFGSLDHAFSSAGLTPRIKGTTTWHINSDEPVALDYNNYNQPGLYQPDQFFASDHDPVLVGICEGTPPTLELEARPHTLVPVNRRLRPVLITWQVQDADQNVAVELLSVTSNQPADTGQPGDKARDIIIRNNNKVVLRAEAYGDTRVYTITYQATDSCGNSTIESVYVYVPYDSDH